MRRTADVLIVGGGIAGLTSALAAAERALSVLVVDSPRAGAASRAAAGILAPSVEGMPPSVLPSALDARDMYPEFLARLRERADVRVALDRRGILELATSDSALASNGEQRAANGERLDSTSLARLEPALAHHPGAVLHPGDGAVDNVALMEALEVAVSREPHITRVSREVTSVDVSTDRPTTCAGPDAYESAFVLLASGAWATGLAGLPRALPVRPLRGQLVRLDALPVHHVIYGGGGYLVPRAPSLVIGATSEEAGFTNQTSLEGLAQLRGIARRVVPGLEGANVIDHWAGLRPITPDTLPILGPDPEYPALVYACGFSRNGILFAPWAAARLAPLFSGEKASDSLAVFSVSRLT